MTRASSSRSGVRRSPRDPPRAVGTDEVDVVALSQNSYFPVGDHGVARTAQREEVVQVGQPAVGPVVDVVRLDEVLMRASGHGTLTSPHRGERLHLGFAGQPALSPVIDDQPVGVGEHAARLCVRRDVCQPERRHRSVVGQISPPLGVHHDGHLRCRGELGRPGHPRADQLHHPHQRREQQPLRRQTRPRFQQVSLRGVREVGDLVQRRVQLGVVQHAVRVQVVAHVAHPGVVRQRPCLQRRFELRSVDSAHRAPDSSLLPILPQLQSIGGVRGSARIVLHAARQRLLEPVVTQLNRLLNKHRLVVRRDVLQDKPDRRIIKLPTSKRLTKQLVWAQLAGNISVFVGAGLLHPAITDEPRRGAAAPGFAGVVCLIKLPYRIQHRSVALAQRVARFHYLRRERFEALRPLQGGSHCPVSESSISCLCEH